MARFLRGASFLRRSLFLEESKRGLLETHDLLRHFATKSKKKTKSDVSDSGDKVISKKDSEGKKKKKSNSSDSGESEMSKKDLGLKLAIDQITASFGKGSIVWLGRSAAQKKTPVISTGSFALDIALGIGGFPKGRVVEIYGPETSGKTTLCLQVIAEAQKEGGSCAFIDAERVFDPSFAEAVGVKTENLLLQQPVSGEQALTLVDSLIRNDTIDVIVVDSVAALVPEPDIDGEMVDAHMPIQAKLMGQALRKFSHSLSLRQKILIFTNQVWGTSGVSCGGNALKFFASVRLNVRRTELVRRGEEIIGSKIAVTVMKNKHSAPCKEVEFELESGKGISRESELIDLGCKHKLITQSGSSLRMNDVNHQDKDALKRYLSENVRAREELEEKLREKLLNEDDHKDETTTHDDPVLMAEA